MSRAVRLALPAWTTRELLTASVIAMAFTVAVVSFTYVYAAVLGLGIFARSAVTGSFFLPAAFAVYVLRKPGAAFLVSAVSGLAAIPFTPYGLLVLGIGVLTGIVGELSGFVITRYRRFGIMHVVGFGAFAGIVEFGLVLLSSLRTSTFTAPVLLAAIGIAVATFVLAALVAVALAHAVRRTGVLINTAFGREEAFA
ncbi:MAG: ECF transporter S component [Anaerolineae bacterium]|nr:ECF transporter S component [Thermoflexales bacterium]MDW8394990.1 ECF transporter S component [Anaerolineae bacterium]